jgi:hypothetical protein
VTAWVENQYKGDSVLSIAIRMIDERTDWNSAEPYWRDREYSDATYRPRLVIIVRQA